MNKCYPDATKFIHDLVVKKIVVLFFVISSCFAQKKQSNQSATLQGYEITIYTQNISKKTLKLSLQYGAAKKVDNRQCRC